MSLKVARLARSTSFFSNTFVAVQIAAASTATPVSWGSRSAPDSKLKAQSAVRKARKKRQSDRRESAPLPLVSRTSKAKASFVDLEPPQRMLKPLMISQTSTEDCSARSKLKKSDCRSVEHVLRSVSSMPSISTSSRQDSSKPDLAQTPPSLLARNTVFTYCRHAAAPASEFASSFFLASTFFLRERASASQSRLSARTSEASRRTLNGVDESSMENS
mmetsp:Transcript_29312/g.93973  ORF Transcript_29312/g.93973 Transcript_29312/m.93973 type:complete len:218 (-) Transcript_29312:102-755(-)